MFQRVTAAFERELALTHALIRACETAGFVGAAVVDVDVVLDVALDVVEVVELEVVTDEVDGVLELDVVLLVGTAVLELVLELVVAELLEALSPDPVQPARASDPTIAKATAAPGRVRDFRNIRPPCNARAAPTKSADGVRNTPAGGQSSSNG